MLYEVITVILSNGVITEAATARTAMTIVPHRAKRKSEALRIAARSPSIAAVTASSAKVFTSPNRGTSRKPVTTVPAIPPNVFNAMTLPVITSYSIHYTKLYEMLMADAMDSVIQTLFRSFFRG